VQGDEKLAKVLTRYEPVEQHYDGLKGKIIKWTLENGNTNHDPSILVFVVGADGKVFSSLMNGQQYQAAALSKWALEQANAYEKAHPSLRLPFVRAKVALRGEGTDAKAVCSALDEAREAKKPVLLYFGRSPVGGSDTPTVRGWKAAKKEAKRSRKFEKGTLNSKVAAKEATGWILLRFDLADTAAARLAKTWDVKAAPALVLFEPGASSARVLDRKISGYALAALLKKHKAAAPKK